MEGLTRLAAESLARHGFDRPLDYRRLHWSRWFRCESHHSLLAVPSQPGVFALAEEIGEIGKDHVGTAALGGPAEPSSAEVLWDAVRGSSATRPNAAEARRMLAVTQFYEADDMAFMLDRMLSYQNPMRARLASGRYFFRFVVIEDASQRRSISSALNTWMTSSAEKATGIGSQFASSMELATEPSQTGVPRVSPPLGDPGGVLADSPRTVSLAKSSLTAPHLDSGAAANIHCPPFPSGF